MSTSCVQFRRAWVEGRTEKDSHVHRAEKVCPSDVQVGTVLWRGWDPKMGIRSQTGLPAGRHQFGRWAGNSGAPPPASAQPVLPGSLREASASVKEEGRQRPVLPQSPPWSGRDKERTAHWVPVSPPPSRDPAADPCWDRGCWEEPWAAPGPHCSLDTVWAGLLRSWRSHRAGPG